MINYYRFEQCFIEDNLDSVENSKIFNIFNFGDDKHKLQLILCLKINFLVINASIFVTYVMYEKQRNLLLFFSLIFLFHFFYLSHDMSSFNILCNSVAFFSIPVRPVEKSYRREENGNPASGILCHRLRIDLFLREEVS